MRSWLPSGVPVPPLCSGRDTRNKPTVSTVGPTARELRSSARDDRRLAVVRGGETFCRPWRGEFAGSSDHPPLKPWAILSRPCRDAEQLDR